MRRVNFKTFLVLPFVVGLVGCGNDSHGATVEYKTHIVDYVKVKSFKTGESIQSVYKTKNGNCYLKYDDWREGSFSQVDCRDFGMEDSNELPNDKTLDSTLLEYIYNNCVVEDEYGDFPRTEGDSWSKTLSGKKLQCQLPENIDKDINERKLYETLKNKYEEE